MNASTAKTDFDVRFRILRRFADTNFFGNREKVQREWSMEKLVGTFSSVRFEVAVEICLSLRPDAFSFGLVPFLKVPLVHVTGTSASTATERAIALLELIDDRHDELLERVDELSARVDQVLAEFGTKKNAPAPIVNSVESLAEDIVEKMPSDE